MTDQVPSNEWGVAEAFKTLEAMTAGSSAAIGAMAFLRAHIKRLNKPAHERESPHCSTCSCGMQPSVCLGGCGTSVPSPHAYCSACFLKARAEQRSEPPVVTPAVKAFEDAMMAAGVPHETLEVYESNSWRRVGLASRYKEVMYPMNDRDGHPYITGTDVLRALVAAFNVLIEQRPAETTEGGQK